MQSVTFWYEIVFKFFWYYIFISYLHWHELICKLIIIVVFDEQDEMSVVLCYDTNVLLLSYCTLKDSMYDA